MEGSLPQKPLQHQERMAVLLCHCPADLAEPSKAMLQRGTRAGIQAQLLHSGWQEVSNWTLGAMERWLLTSETAGSAREPAAEQQWVTNLQSSPGDQSHSQLCRELGGMDTQSITIQKLSHDPINQRPTV